MSKLFSVESSDWFRGLVTAAFSGGVMAFLALVGSTGFDLFTANWKNIISLTIAGAVSGGMGYISRKFSTTSEGKVLGMQVDDIS